MNELPKRQLSLLDFAVLGVIFFGYFTVTSIRMYLMTTNPQPPQAGDFSTDGNISSILFELLLLAIAGLYLWWRRFDFSILPFGVSRETPLHALLILLCGGLTMDIIGYGAYWWTYGVSPFAGFKEWSSTGAGSVFGHVTLWLVLFSMLNGFFEELFFMGLTFATEAKYRIYAIILSVFIRFGFHLYQGITSAVGIALMGVVFILIRRKVHSLVPFMLVHALFDVLGSGVLYWIFLLLYGL